jgi:diaminopimelate epimerase
MVELPGGDLEITWPAPGEHIWMKGPTAVSFTGRVEI